MAGGVVTPNAIPTTDAPWQGRPVAIPGAGDRWARLGRRLTWGAFGIILVLAALAPISRTGDAHQYYAMATALADFRPPALTSEEVEQFKAWLQAQPAASGFASSVRAVDQPPLVVDGRQEFSHFWLYPLLAAPAVRLMNAVDLHPGYAFLAVNAALLAAALWQVQRTYGAVVGLLVLASPLIWFVNKAQVEVFTFSLLCIAMALAGRGRWLGAGLAAAIASTQNAPILAATAFFWGTGLLRWAFDRRLNLLTPNLGGTRTRPSPGARVNLGGILLVVLTMAVGALHPAYYQWRLGVLTPQRLNGGIDLRWPSPEKYFAVLLDPDIGLIPWLPLTGLIALLGLFLVWWPARTTPGSASPKAPPKVPQSWGENGSAPQGSALANAGTSSVGELLAAPVERSSTTSLVTRSSRWITRLWSWRTTGAASSSPTTEGAVRPQSRPQFTTPPRFGGPGGRPLEPGAPLLQDRRLAALCGLVIGAWFLFVFAQTTNVNSGGTVHISRYALWLLPLTLPLLAATADWLHPRLPALLPVLGGLTLVIYAAAFQPAQAERYVAQSPQAALVTTWLPELYRTVPEIFYERQVGTDGGVRGSAADASCHVILLHTVERAQPCALRLVEEAAATNLFASGWEAAWIIRPGPLGLGEGGVRGALPSP